MNLNRSFIRILAVTAVLASGAMAVHFAALAAETGPAIHVDNSPLNREPQSGNSYSPVVKKVAPSVVNIYSSRIVQRSYHSPMMNDPFFRQFFGDMGEGRNTTRRENWLGSGIIVTPDGYILTANHVVDGADEIKVGLQNDKATYSAKVVGMDPPTDVAILKIEAKNLPAVTLGNSDQLEVGDVVLAVGDPFGIGQTVTRGIISALGRSLADMSDMESPHQAQYQNFIQTDAAINQGNSGGALVDAQGRLIGINDAIVSPSGTSAGVGFAVPVNMARNVLEGFINHGKVERGYLGIEPQDIDSGLAKGFGTPNADGALVADVTPGSPAAKGGLMSGDVIVAINDKGISGADNLSLTISELPPGSKANLKIYRNGTPKTLVVTLGDRASLEHDSARQDNNGNNNDTVQPAKADALDGVEVQDLTTRLRGQLRAPQGVTGALVADVNRLSNSFDAGLRPGDVLLEINHQPVANAEDAVRLGKAARTEQIVVKIWRHIHGTSGGITRFLSVDNTKHSN
jgi:serine protease Do